MSKTFSLGSNQVFFDPCSIAVILDLINVTSNENEAPCPSLVLNLEVMIAKMQNGSDNQVK
jgi:hypothetical protein